MKKNKKEKKEEDETEKETAENKTSDSIFYLKNKILKENKIVNMLL